MSDLAAVVQRASVIVHGNVALATHGETVQQLLGSGRASAPFQRFTLAHEPLRTCSRAAIHRARTRALDVRVNDVRWDEVPTLFGAGPRDRAYALRSDEAGRRTSSSATASAARGCRRARTTCARSTARASARRGNVKAGALAQLLDRPLGVKGVSNPEPASGGVDPESEESARASIPLGVRTLGRAVSLLDYEDFARAFSGVAKANAAVLQLRAGATVVVTVAFEGGDRLDDLADALRTHGDPRVEVLVLAGTTQTFKLALKVVGRPCLRVGRRARGRRVRAACRVLVRRARVHGAGLPSGIESVAHTVAGVLAVDVDRLYTGTTAGVPTGCSRSDPP